VRTTPARERFGKGRRNGCTSGLSQRTRVDREQRRPRLDEHYAEAPVPRAYLPRSLGAYFGQTDTHFVKSIASIDRSIADWDAITPTLDGRVCYLAFDSDGFTKDSEGLALRRLANFLARRGALVFIVHLPDADDGSKQGRDDFVAAHGREALLDLVDDAEPWGSIGMVRRLQARSASCARS
jgi:hypothetical protein